jgi:CheY-like chemotaxis protein
VATARPIEDDRHAIGPMDQVLLIVEDDPNFARVLLDRARAMDFKGVVSSRADEAVALAYEYRPHAITLDLHLVDSEGWRVLERLKNDPDTRHIPVHIISVDEERERGLTQGALSFLTKPVSKEALDGALGQLKAFIKRSVKNLLVVEDDEVQRNAIIDLIGNGDVQTTAVATGTEAIAALETGQYDCLVLDLGLSDMTGFQLLDKVKKSTTIRQIPVIVYTGKELTRKEETQLKRLAETIIIKGVHSPERLLDETALFLHRVSANLPAPKRKVLEQLHQTDAVLANKKVLIVDDDIRNLFAMTGVLERYKMEVLSAENGKDAVEVLEERPDVDLVLMDVMMPEMDGYDTMRAIRRNPKFKSLPIIAITAKAMKGDRQKCIDAGASDYISKPVDTDQLLSLMRVWLYR